MIMPMRVAALVLAAGSSQRFGRPKQFEDLGGTTVLQHAVRAFTEAEGIAETWVVTSAEHRTQTADLLVDEGIAGVIRGGDSRAQSTQLGLDALAPEVSHVIVHDAARPLVPRQVVAKCLAALAGGADVVATVVEPVDSVVILDGDVVVSTPERSSVRLYQTPQAFRCSVLTAAWELLAADQQGSPTDDVTAVLKAFPEQPVAWVPGHRRSAKITEPDDLAMLRAWLEDDA